MQPERRWSSRRPIALNVALYYNRIGLLPCKTRDMSTEGMFVQTRHVSLSEGITVDAVLTDQGSFPGHQLRLPAKIVRVNFDGVGLRFHNFDIDTYHFLRTVLETLEPVSAA
ncbi:MAG: PilZ domain-containing protein [Acidiferrobacterales bacterium]|jgi:hypothetical protein|nr:PilZ domain-containing protein [Acidiferrobacterales bacterium]